MKKDNANKYLAKGQMVFVQTKDGLKECKFDRDFYMNEYKDTLGSRVTDYVDFIYNSKFTFDIYKIIPGKEFLEYVQSGYFINGDGTISGIFADGFKCNLGLFTDNLISGEGCFVDEEMWLDLCDRYNIEVNWANK